MNWLSRGDPGGDRAGGRDARRHGGRRARPHEFCPTERTGPFPLALAAAVLTVAYFGLALQYFQLRFARRGMMYFGLFLFIFWVLPLRRRLDPVDGAPGRWRSEAAGYPVFALSPVAGIGMIDAIGDEPLAYSVQAAALTPILLFTFVFNYLLIGARRRVMKSVFARDHRRRRRRPGWSSWQPVAGVRVEWAFEPPCPVLDTITTWIGDRSS